MKVHGHGAGQSPMAIPSHHHLARRQAQAAQGTAHPDPSASAVQSRNAHKVPGVIRLLENGHFRGVADVRLRINFFNVLADRADAQLRASAAGRAAELIDAVNQEAQALFLGLGVQDQGKLEDVLDEFESAVRDASAEFSSGGELPGLQSSIERAFDVLVQAVSPLLAAGEPAADPGILTPQADDAEQTTDPTDSLDPAESPVLSEAVSAEPESANGDAAPPEVDESSAVEDPLQRLTSVFKNALAALVEALEVSSALPDPAPAPGNGQAYDKFMAIYRQLLGRPAQVNEVS